ncbi:MAG: type IV secretion system protein [Acetobacter sp.]|nr:type IV secretion system protein [Acetobacter sp.]
MLNISFLQKTPVWVFFCFCAVVLLLAPVESHATTQIPSLGYMDDITNGFNTELQRWGNTFEQAAEALFLMLIPIAMVWRFGQIAMQGGGATEALAELVRFLIFAGFYYELCTKGIYIANLVFTSILDLTTKASGFSTSDSGITGNGYFTPSGIINLGLSVLTVLIKSLHVWSLAVNPSATLFSLICGLIFLILCAIVAVNLLLAYISVWFWMYVGAFILGFGARPLGRLTSRSVIFDLFLMLPCVRLAWF